MPGACMHNHVQRLVSVHVHFRRTHVHLEIYDEQACVYVFVSRGRMMQDVWELLHHIQTSVHNVACLGSHLDSSSPRYVHKLHASTTEQQCQ